MQNEPTSDSQKTIRTEFGALFGSTKLVLDEKPKAITPFGGLTSFVNFLGQIAHVRAVQQALPFPTTTSNNVIPLACTLIASKPGSQVGSAEKNPLRD